MRFYESAAQPRPVLKISQQQPRQAEIQANSPPTPFQTNAPATPTPQSVKEYSCCIIKRQPNHHRAWASSRVAKR